MRKKRAIKETGKAMMDATPARRISNNALAFIIVLVMLVSVFSTLEVMYKTGSGFWGDWEKATGKTTQGSISVCIDALPTFPVIGNFTIYTDILFDHYVIAYDAVEGDIVYFYDNTTLFDIGLLTGRILFTPNSTSIGTHYVDITVTDNQCTGVFLNETQTFKMEILPATLTLDTIPELTAIEDSLFYYDANATNGVTPYNFTSNETWFVINNQTGIISFTPNNSYVGTHRVIVEVRDNASASDSQEVIFTITNTNDAPRLDMKENKTRNLMPNQTMMENSLFYYDVNATDDDLDVPNSTEVLYFQENTPMFVINENTGVIYFTANEPYFGNITFDLSVSDGEVVDTQKVTFEIFWVNDMPNLTTETVFTHYYADGNFSYDMTGSDEEDGGESSGNLTFWGNSTSLGVGRTNGNLTLNITSSDLGSTYRFNVSLNDTLGGITSKEIAITIVNTNRAPIISAYTPTSLSFTISETDTKQFTTVAYDPDGTTPVMSWYIDNSSQGITSQDFTYSTNYASAGVHNITVFASDGLLATAVTWTVTVLNAEPPPTPQPTTGGVSGGGGGGGAPRVCKPMWVCEDWSRCFKSNLSTACLKTGIRGYECGMESRKCTDINKCGLEKEKPEESKACIYISSPSCFDGVKNNGEFGIDCGGNCVKPCPTCNDNIQNQGETGVDCGGPCKECEKNYEVKEISGWIISLGMFLLILLLLIAVRIAYRTAKKYVLVYGR
jgi:hypothetical protein